MPRRLTLFPLRYHHEGDSQPLPVDLKGGHQTLTNSTGVITMFNSSPKNSYPPRSLQPPRVTTSMGKISILLTKKLFPFNTDCTCADSSSKGVASPCFVTK